MPTSNYAISRIFEEWPWQYTNTLPTYVSVANCCRRLVSPLLRGTPPSPGLKPVSNMRFHPSESSCGLLNHCSNLGCLSNREARIDSSVVIEPHHPPQNPTPHQRQHTIDLVLSNARSRRRWAGAGTGGPWRQRQCRGTGPPRSQSNGPFLHSYFDIRRQCAGGHASGVRLGRLGGAAAARAAAHGRRPLRAAGVLAQRHGTSLSRPITSLSRPYHACHPSQIWRWLQRGCAYWAAGMMTAVC